MKTHPWFLQISDEVAQAINERYMPVLEALLAAHEVDGNALGVTQVAYAAEPDATTAAIFLERTPYMTETAVLANLDNGVEHGLLTAVAPQTYRLTEKGRVLAQAIPASVLEIAAGLTPLPAAQLERLAALLRQLVDASLAAPNLAKPCLERSRLYDPGAAAPVVERIRRYLNDLNAFRDDAHISAWRSYELAGYEWETLGHVHGAYVFGEPAVTAVALAEKLGGFRGYDVAAYQAALDKLTARGWLTVTDGQYAATAEGEQMRAAAEEETDRLYFAPWALTGAELADLSALLTAVRDGLQLPAQEAETA